MSQDQDGNSTTAHSMGLIDKSAPGYIGDYYAELFSEVLGQMGAAERAGLTSMDGAAVLGFVLTLDGLRYWERRITMANENGFPVGQAMATAYAMSTGLGINRSSLAMLIRRAESLFEKHLGDKPEGAPDGAV